MAASLILVGIDFSDAAAMAVEEASRVARSVGGRVVGLHAPDGDGWGWTAEHREWAWQHGLDPADVVVRTGPPWLQLARYADEIRPGMVVVGSHGAGGVHPVAPGSTTMMLLTRVRVPVLVVPSYRPPHRAEP